MLCCVGLLGGFAVGQALGGPWTVIAPAAGFGLGLVADMKMMRGRQKAAERQGGTEFRAEADADPNAPNSSAAAGPAAESGACCGVASGLSRMLGMKGKQKNGEMTLAEIRKTYQADSTEPSVRG